MLDRELALPQADICQSSLIIKKHEVNSSTDRHTNRGNRVVFGSFESLCINCSVKVSRKLNGMFSVTL